jgi:hypothetical protein
MLGIGLLMIQRRRHLIRGWKSSAAFGMKLLIASVSF